MGRIRRRDTAPERIVRSALFRAGLRFRVDHPILGAGRIDIVFPKARLAIQIDGCFWHGCPLHRVTPKGRPAFWQAKLQKTQERDQRQSRLLAATGWVLLRFWEHEIETNLAAVLHTIQTHLDLRSGLVCSTRTEHEGTRG